MVTITLQCLHCGSEALVRDGHAQSAHNNIAVMPVGVAAVKPLSPMPIQKHVARKCCMLIKNAVVCAASRVRLASHVRPCPVGSKKVAQLPPLSTTLLAPDPVDPTSTILELDERMARLCSKKPTTPGFGLPCAARDVKWSLMLSGIGAKRRVNGCGRPSQTAIVLVTASRISG